MYINLHLHIHNRNTEKQSADQGDSSHSCLFVKSVRSQRNQNTAEHAAKNGCTNKGLLSISQSTAKEKG